MDQVTKIASDRKPAAVVELGSPANPWNQSLNVVAIVIQLAGSKACCSVVSWFGKVPPLEVEWLGLGSGGEWGPGLWMRG
jgi:hypothetical protein